MIKFISDDADFALENPQYTNYLYFPLANENGAMSSITPDLNGDFKTNQNTFLLLPVSAEDLHNSRAARNFWLYIEGSGVWSVSGNSAEQISHKFDKKSYEKVTLEGGFLYHKLTRENSRIGIKSETLNFVPCSDENAEIMQVTLKNTGNKSMIITPTAAVPIYGRSADNIRDHRHVTSLLHRIYTSSYGVIVKPSLSFDERGHKKNNMVYSVQGTEDNGDLPSGFFPVVEDYIGEGGNFENPLSVVCNLQNYCKPNAEFEGYEAVGALRFKRIVLNPGECKTYIVILGITKSRDDADKLVRKYGSLDKVRQSFNFNRRYWNEKLSSLSFTSNRKSFDRWMKWVTLQPVLRRIYGCSFLPHHDYGKGGRGWRDLWQDCLALIITEPQNVQNLLYNDFAGVRTDGSNATIIGEKPGEFVSDRNNIPRVWMDHGAWPFLTVKFYIDRSGDIDFLFRKQCYFKDKFINRSLKVDKKWNDEYGNKLRDKNGNIYEGTILEHLLVENVTPFYNVGAHNNIKLENGDWNDGIDMASDKGESVAFTALYAGNLIELSKLLQKIKLKRGIHRIEIFKELLPLFDTIYKKIDYDSVEEKNELLERYFDSCANVISGEKISVPIDDIISDLSKKGNYIIEHIREKEWIEDGNSGWFNSYYDNDSMKVEGRFKNGVRMILTGQVFSIMENVATKDQVRKIILAADLYLKDEKSGGYRLNTNFHELKLNMGRLFGFAYGHKENGSMFSHMAIMYANALYKRGYVREGYETISSIYEHCIDFEKSRIYPGIPEYMNEKGRGMYSYLTGAASWLIITLLCESYGVNGDMGDIVIEPKLLKDQFDSFGRTSVNTIFAGRKLNIIYSNDEKLEYGDYSIKEADVDDTKIDAPEKYRVVIKRSMIEKLDQNKTHDIVIKLGR